MGFPPYIYSQLPPRQRKFLSSVLDISLQTDMKLLAKKKKNFKSFNEFDAIPKKAYSRARFELLDFMTKYGHFHHLPHHERMCISSSSATKDIAHVLVDCQLYAPFGLRDLLERTIH